MTQRTSTVVPEIADVTEAEFRGAMVSGLARAEKLVTRKALAEAMDLSTKQVGNILEKGASTDPKRLWDARVVCETALDDIADLYGVRIVPKDAVCDVDDLALLLSRVLVMINEAEHPAGPGGRAVVPQEYLTGEPLMRELHAASGRWLEKCAAIRRPRSVA